MKRILLSFFAILIVSLAYAQDYNATFKVTNYEINGVNCDSLALNGDVALTFYMCDKNTFCFAIHWRNNNTQSYGRVYALKKKDIPETSTTYSAEEFKFAWQVFNTYDNKKGEAAVTFTRIRINNTVKFTAEVLVLNSNENLIFQGYLE